MKLFALALALLSSTSAYACPRNQQQFICPGDPVVDMYNRAGRVRAVNPFQKVASYALNNGAIVSSDIENLALGMGCLEAFCVGDYVVDMYNRAGRVMAINPYSRVVAYQLTNGAIVSSDAENMLVGYGCTLGYCTKDEVVDMYNREGTIIALSPYQDVAAYRLNNGAIVSSDIQNLSNSKFCEDYGVQHRQHRRFPALPKHKYLSPSFPYYSKR